MRNFSALDVECHDEFIQIFILLIEKSIHILLTIIITHGMHATATIFSFRWKLQNKLFPLISHF